MAKGKKSLKEIIAEELLEKEKREKEEREKQEREKEENEKLEAKRREEMYCSDLESLQIYDSPQEFSWLKRFRYERVDRIIRSLLLPEQKNKTIRYINYINYAPDEKKANLFDLLSPTYMVIELYYMYTSYYLLCWVQDDVYKILEFNRTRCPSGGCNGESIHQLVGISVEDVLKLIDFRFRKEDREKIKLAFESLPNKQRIIERTKAVKEEMMATFWHPDRFEKWQFDDDSD